jgi:hypothetical protein
MLEGIGPVLKKHILPIFALLFIYGCSRDEDIYPRRPKEAPYYYNETSITEMDQSARIDLKDARERTNIEFVTVVLKKIPSDMSIGEYASGLFDKWRIGSRTDGKGVLILFTEETHTLKIEVSYNLEGIFTDAYCSSFQPTVKSYYAGRYFGDVFGWLVECLERRILLGAEKESASMIGAPVTDPDLLKSSEVFLSGGGGIIDDEYYYEKDAKLSFIKALAAERLPEFEADEDVEVVLDRYFKSLEEGINYPFLGLLTEGSQYHHLEYPESEHFYKSRWEDCLQAFPYKVKYKGDLAAVRFQNNQSFPIFLRRDDDGLWRVDAARAWVSSWQDFMNNKSGPLHRDHPWMFAFPEEKSKKSLCNVPGLLPSSVNLRGEISRLEDAINKEPQNASNYFRLADIFYWDCLWVRSAIDLVEKGLELEPYNVPYRWLAIRMRYRFPCPEPNGKHLEKLLEINPDDVDALYRYSVHCWFYTMEYKKSMRFLRKIKDTERKLSILLNFKHYYWKQVVVDKNVLWRTWNYFYIFYVSKKVLYGSITALLIVLLSICRKRFWQRKKDLSRFMVCS